MKVMIFEQAVAWTVANRPKVANSLLEDIAAIQSGAAPTQDDLASAPNLDRWMPVVAGGLVFLSGQVQGHPKWSNGRLTTSTICVIDAQNLTWVRTGSRYYNLGKYFSGFEILRGAI